MESIYDDGFEFRAPSYSYEYITDQFVVAQPDRSYEFEVVVRRSDGNIVTAGQVGWTSSNPAVASVAVLSPRRVRVTVIGKAPPGVIRITARHQDTTIESNAQLVFATLQPTSRFVSGAALVSANATSATFVANAETEAIVAGDVVMVGDSRALLVRINSISNAGSQRIAQTSPAYVSEYFVPSAPPVLLASDPLQLQIDVRNGLVSYSDANSRLLARFTLQPDAISCETSGGGSVSIDVNRIVINGTQGGAFSTWRVSYDWRTVGL